jgi:hypothetical protein
MYLGANPISGPVSMSRCRLLVLSSVNFRDQRFRFAFLVFELSQRLDLCHTHPVRASQPQSKDLWLI